MVIRCISAALLVATMAAVAATEASAAEVSGADDTSTATVSTCSGGTINLTSEEKRVLDLHNSTRKHHGRKPLCVHPDLQEAARAHSKEMINKDYTSHSSFNGETLKERLERYGYTFDGYSYWRCGENIYWGSGSYGDPDRAFKWWMHSSAHRGNILEKSFREVGIGVAKGTYKTYSGTTMYTVDFGMRRS